MQRPRSSSGRALDNSWRTRGLRAKDGRRGAGGSAGGSGSGELVDEVHHVAHGLDRRVLEDAVAKIEDVTAA